MRRALTASIVLVMMAAVLVIVVPSPPVAAAGQVSQYMPGLNWPIALAFASDGRIFFAERLTGRIRIIENGTLRATPFYTLANTATAGERGLLGLALNPRFPSTPFVYAYQTYADSTNATIYNRIVRIVANGNTGVSHTVILRMPPLSNATNHNGGVIDFGPDGKLYAVVGENANAALSQDPLSPMGKVLRMNTDGSAPTDNPFYGNPAMLNLTYTYGHRNMFGLAFHPVTGRAYVTENGPACNDEINLLIPGRNYGWGPLGFAATCPSPPDINVSNQDGPNPVLPIWWWPSTICPTNVAIYGGPYLPAYRGDLFMGDCNFGVFHRLHLAPPNYDTVISDTPVWTAPSLILAVKQGRDGAIWITTPSTIYRYWDSAQPPVASFTATPNPAIVNTTVTFNGSASHDPDGTITSYAWAFGDTTIGSGAITSHPFATVGVFNVTLTVTDNETYTATTFRNVVVQASPPGPQPPVAQFVVGPSPTNPRTPVTFNASSSYDPDGTITSYRWNFGDSSTGTGITATHAYLVAGVFTATLNVTDNQTLSSTATHQVIVRDRAPQITSSAPGLGPVTSSVGLTQPFSVAATDPDGDPLTYTWRVNGALTGGNTNPFNFSATTTGTYTVNVTVSDGTLATWREWTVTVGALISDPYVQLIPWVLVVVVVAVFAALILISMRRRKREQEPPAPPPPP